MDLYKITQDLLYVQINVFDTRMEKNELVSIFMNGITGNRTASSRLCVSIKAENSTSLSLCVAMARPSQTGGGAVCKAPTSPGETAVVGLPAGYADCEKGFTLKTTTTKIQLN